jgi:hypothetical protein
MRTTSGSIRRAACIAALCLAVGLQGCISPTQYARPDTNEAQLTADTHDCTQWDPAVKGVVTGVGYGAMTGIAASASGVRDRDAAIVALLIGVIYGMAFGAIAAQEDVKYYDRCMLAKGYHATG